MTLHSPFGSGVSTRRRMRSGSTWGIVTPLIHGAVSSKHLTLPLSIPRAEWDQAKQDA
jgi:hypothetical protein